MRRLTLFCGGFAAACLLTVYWRPRSVLALTILAVLCIACYCIRYPLCRRIAIFLLGVFIGSGWCIGQHALLHPADAELPGSTVTLTATADGLVEQAGYGWILDVTVTEPNAGNATLYFREKPKVLPGDTLQCMAKFAPTSENDIGDHTLFGSVQRDLIVRPCDDPSLIHRLRRFAGAVRERLYSLLPSETAGFYTALIVGEKSGISKSLKSDMSQCGTLHTISLSGMHISLLMGFVMLLCGKRRALAAGLGIPVLVCFTIFSGAGNATTRAAVMQILLLLAPLLRREYDPITSLSAALLLLLVKDPWSIANQGLQLSFLSTAGILLFSRRIFERITPKSWQDMHRRKILKTVFSGLSLTLSALFLTSPLLLLYFGVVSIAAPLTNLLTIWAITLSFPLGLITVLFSFFVPVIAYWLTYPLQWFYGYITFISRFFGRLPFCAVYIETPILSWGMVLVQTLLVLGLVLECRRSLAVSCTAAVFATTCLLHFLSPSPEEFTALNVGQGQCLILQSCGKTFLFDCGGSGGDTAATAVRWLQSHRSYSVDTLLLTHFDSDHVEGVPQLLQEIPVGELLIPADAPDCAEKETILTAAQECKVPVREADHLLTYQWEYGTVKVFPPIGTGDENNRGLSALISVEDYDILLTGDMDFATEIELLRQYPLPDLEVLVAGHHGSANSTSHALLDLLHPEIVLISVGQNSYGHPEDSTLSRIEQFGATAYRTDITGNLTVRW